MYSSRMGFPRNIPSFFGICWTQHNPQNTESVLKPHDNKKYGTKNTPKLLKSRRFPFGSSGWDSSHSQIPSQPHQTQIWFKIHLEIHEKMRCRTFLLLSWKTSSDLGWETTGEIPGGFYSQEIIDGYGIITGFSNKVHARKNLE